MTLLKLRPTARRTAFPLLALAAALLPAPAFAGVPEDIKSLIEQRRAAEGYELGLQHTEMLGQPLFDYYFGIAAVDAGRATLGVLALERFMLQDPSNDLARLELGRAYYVIGDFARAAREFNAVMAKNPPPGVQNTIKKFMAAMRSRTKDKRTEIAGFLELGVGGTDNANSGLASPDITLPIFGPVKLDNSALKKASESAQVLGGVSVVTRLGKNFRAIFNGAATTIHYSRTSNYDIAAVTALAAAGYVTDKLTITLGPTGSYALLAGNKYRRGTGIATTVRASVGKKTTVRIEGNALDLAYFGINRNRTGRLYSASLGIDRQLSLPLKPTLSLTGSYAREKNRRGRADFSRKIVGGRADIALYPTDKIALGLGYGLSRWTYDEPDLLFGIKRKDWFKSLDATVQFMLKPGLSLRLQGQMTHDDANIPLYEYDQKQISVILKREWN